MMDLFTAKKISPMLIKDEVEVFDDPDYLYELKFDGIRCIAYLDSNEKTQLFNKRQLLLNMHFPELMDIHKNVKGRCILDGEVFVMRDGRPNFADVQRRALTSDKYKIELQAKRYPASFVAYDILYYRGKSITDLPLLQRKAKLEMVVKQENGWFSYSRFSTGQGVLLYKMTKEQNLEGIVAKRADSKYYQGKKTNDWVKIKNMLDDDYVICGYVVEGYIRTLILGQYAGEELVYKGRVTGISKAVFSDILAVPKMSCPFSELTEEDAVWIKPELVCKVKFMEYTAGGGMRQPAFVALRDDKLPRDCVVKKSEDSTSDSEKS